MDEFCRELALTLGITEQSLVCRPCRNDIARLRKDPCHCPRWEKERISECAVLQCRNKSFSKCNIPMSDIVLCLELAGESVPSQLDTAPSLCKHHYHMVYNAHKPRGLRLMHVDASAEDRAVPKVVSAMNVVISLTANLTHLSILIESKGSKTQPTLRMVIVQLSMTVMQT